MTVVVVKDGVIASDSQISQGDVSCGFTQKIWVTKIGAVGLCGNPMECAQLYKWTLGWENEAAPPEPIGGGQGYLLTDTGRTYIIDDGKPVRLVAPFLAIGSGGEVAMGAMAMGASAQEAVEIAISLENNCSGEVQWWDIKTHSGVLFDELYGGTSLTGRLSLTI